MSTYRTDNRQPRRARFPRSSLLALALLTAAAPAAHAAQAGSGEIAELRAELEALKVEQAQRDAEQAERDGRMQRIEEALLRLSGEPAASPAPVATAAAVSPPAPASAPSMRDPAAVAAGDAASRLKVSGDLRLRAQGDWSDNDAKNRGSMQLRGRLGATFAATDRVTIGARLATGDSDDPNSTDVQLSNWLDDLEVSLDQAYLQLNFDSLTLYGGKMPQPFVRTDLVWDGDVNPQGIGAVWQKPLAHGGTLRMNGLAFIVDEQAGGSDSTMLGAQLGYESPARGDWKFDLNGAYYHYDLGSVAGADAGDFRSNLLDSDGRYLSEFHLANLLFGVTYGGFGERWPLRLVGDYVYNTGAATDADTGYGADLVLGRAAQPGDWRLTYGYSMAQTDAVLAAFSHDNIGIATNYRLHGLTVDYVPMPRTLVSAYWYHYRPYSALDAGANDPGDWLDRLRLAFMVSF